MTDLEQAIRERAYLLWLASGGEHGRAEQHWLDAQREILSETLCAVARVTCKSDAHEAASSKPSRAPRRKRRAA